MSRIKSLIDCVVAIAKKTGANTIKIKDSRWLYLFLLKFIDTLVCNVFCHLAINNLQLYNQ